MDNSHDRDRISSRIKCNDCLASRHQKSSGELRLCRQRENYIVELSLTILIVDGVIGYFALDLYCESAYACQIAPCNLDTSLWTEGVSLCAALDSTMLPPSVSFL
jgi:hypothetical protein